LKPNELLNLRDLLDQLGEGGRGGMWLGGLDIVASLRAVVGVCLELQDQVDALEKRLDGVIK
jgi:hypothetical protein